MPDSYEIAGRGRVTILDVACHAGVSRSTVSLVLRESPLAANMRAARTKTVGLLVCEITNPFFAELTAGADHVLDAAGLAPFLANTNKQVERQDRERQGAGS
ncbi:LacI family DNA-binding transcriptional regulator [Skermanella pratensis]|uniref:LacI family DNA-binding transcriptional regulator n=1 Tax=Skermanella pratensis TaxID=2233999 RepID=UPI0013017C4C|nr:LacI family DNA-binding transcriptional regulator [Skermanella pratensis]